MKSLLTLKCSDGLSYSCGPSCYNGTGSLGDCVCGGQNRNKGRALAARNVRACFKAMAADWQARHPDLEVVAIDIMGTVPNRENTRYD